MTAVPEGFPKVKGADRPWTVWRTSGHEFSQFMSKVEEHESGCWLWTGALNNNGYGRFRDSYSHRWAFEHFVGPIAAGLELDHLCRTPRCCCPSHLEAVTRSVNIRRGTSIAAERAMKTHCPEGHAYDDQNTLRDKRGWRKCRACKNARDRQRWAASHG